MQVDVYLLNMHAIIYLAIIRLFAIKVWCFFLKSLHC